jgi:UDP-N-acetylmuramyl tripeptide synthase
VTVADRTLPPARLPWRARLAVGVGRAVAAASKATHLGSGSVIGGRASLLVEPQLLAALTRGRAVALVSATNGKTTTTRLLATALGTAGPVASNALGANMPPGHVAALGSAPTGAAAVLEVDERWLGQVMAATEPAVVLLLNLSRDQLDRSHEVRKLAQRWHDALTTDPPGLVVANADDPLVAWAAQAAPAVTWVAAGSSWTADATGCPACEGRLAFPDDGSGWRCTACDLHRPEPDVWLEDAPTPSDPAAGTEAMATTGRGAVATLAGQRWPLALGLPGRVNRANAAMALTAALAMGADAEPALAAMAAVHDVAGRYRTVEVAGARARLLLAKNPAGWQEAIDMLAPPPRPVIVSINARVADGHDPSWLWDVPFERLAGRKVVATGERRHDLAVRLRYAEVDHVVAETLDEAVRMAGADEVDVAANYTAFQGYLQEVGG